MENDECETHQPFQYRSSGGSFRGGRSEADGGMLEDDEELQRLERHLEGNMEGVEEAGKSFLVRARQGLASLKRSLSGSGQEEADERTGGSKMELPIGCKGYGADPCSELEQDMQSDMQEAAKLLMDATGRIEGDIHHLHAPELYHPEAVTSYEEMRQWPEESTRALDARKIKKDTIEVTQVTKGGVGSCSDGEGEMKQGRQRNNNSTDEDAVAAKERMGVKREEIDKRTEEEKREDEEEMLEMLQMFTPE